MSCICVNNKNPQMITHQLSKATIFRYGRLNAVRRLLQSECSSNIINECDGDGMTALHIASQNGHIRVVQLLFTCYVTLEHNSPYTDYHPPYHGLVAKTLHSRPVGFGLIPRLCPLVYQPRYSVGARLHLHSC